MKATVLLAAAAMAWSTYNLGLREGGRDAPPRIVADAGPFRTEPADPGGFQAPDQDIEVYDTLTGTEWETADRFAPPKPAARTYSDSSMDIHKPAVKADPKLANAWKNKAGNMPTV